jgi:hypothetical protein
MEDLSHEDLPIERIRHWDVMGRILRLLERYSIKKLSIEADSSMFQEVLHDAEFREIIPQVRNLDDTLVSGRCHHLTHIHLSMTRYDFKCTGTFNRTQFGLQNATGFRNLLASATKLTDLHIENSRSDPPGTAIDAEWLDLVLGGQYWPTLKHFHLNAALVLLETLTGLLDEHKETLSAVSICDVGMANPGKTVALINFMRENLSTLKRCEVAGHAYYDGTNQGSDALAELLRTVGPFGHVQHENLDVNDDDDDHDETNSDVSGSDNEEDSSEDDDDVNENESDYSTSTDHDTESEFDSDSDSDMVGEDVNLGQIVTQGQGTGPRWCEERQAVIIPEEMDNSEEDW